MAPDTGTIPKALAKDRRSIQSLLARLPRQDLETFTEAQLDALANAADQCKWGQHPTDIRLSIPLLWKRFYVVLIAGEERRNSQRRAEERKFRPLATTGNLFFLTAFTAVGTIVGAFLWTAMLVWYLSG